MRPIHAHFQRIKVAIILYFHLLERLLISNDNSHSMMACLQLACVLSCRRCHVAHWHSLDRFSLFRQRRLLCHSLSVAQSSCIVGQIQLSLPKGILVILFNFFVNKQFFLSAQGKQTRRVEDRREDGKREKKMLLGAFVPFRTCVIAAFAFVFIIVFSESASALNDSQVKCSRTCVAENCNSVGIRYGKYCGVGWSGCPGEKPCDDLDACCKIHDECVDKKGLTNIKCHEKFKRCIKKVQKSAKVGFSRECPYDTVVPTMVQGMDMAILLSQLGGSKFEL